MGLSPGDPVEVYGYYWKASGPLQMMGRVVAFGNSYYIKLLAFQAEIWVDRGCGSQYMIGDPITIYFRTSHDATVQVIDVHGSQTLLLYQGDIVGGLTYTQTGTVGPPEGTVTFIIKAWSGGNYAEDSCVIYAVSVTGEIRVEVVDISTGLPLEDCKVYLDGDYKGTTGSNGVFTITNVEAGTHTLKVTKQRYYNWEDTVTVSAGQTVTVRVELQRMPAVGDLRIGAQESGTLKGIKGAKVYLDNNYAGETDNYGYLTITNVDAGQHSITIEAEGYQTYTATVTVEEGKLNVHIAKMQPTAQPTTTPAPTTTTPPSPSPTTTQPPTTTPVTTPPITTPPPSPGLPTDILILLIILAVVAVVSIIIAITVLRRRKTLPPPPPPSYPPPPGA